MMAAFFCLVVLSLSPSRLVCRFRGHCRTYIHTWESERRWGQQDAKFSVREKKTEIVGWERGKCVKVRKSERDWKVLCRPVPSHSQIPAFLTMVTVLVRSSQELEFLLWRIIWLLKCTTPILEESEYTQRPSVHVTLSQIGFKIIFPLVFKPMFVYCMLLIATENNFSSFRV